MDPFEFQSIEDSNAIIIGNDIRHGLLPLSVRQINDIINENEWDSPLIVDMIRNIKILEGFTYLSIYVSLGNFKAVKSLLYAYPNDVNAASYVAIPEPEEMSILKREPPIITAARFGYYDIVKCLIDAGADVCATAKHNRTSALHVASVEGSLNIVKCLVEAGANVNQKGDFDYIALFEALSENNVDIVRYLVECGSLINAKISVDYPPEFEEEDIDIDDINYNHALHIALVLGFDKIAFYLVQVGCDLDISLSTASALKCFYDAGPFKCDISEIMLLGGTVLPNNFFLTLGNISFKDTKAYMKLLFYKTNSLSLLSLCRIELRRYFQKISSGLSIFPIIDELSIPWSLKSFLRLEDIIM